MTSEPARDPQTPTSGDTATANGQPAGRPAPVRHHVVRRTRAGGVWVAAALFAVVLLLLLIFILENSQHVSIGYFGAHGHLPLGIALLLAAVLGILLVVIPGTARIIQLRITAHRHRRSDAQPTVLAPVSSPAPGPPDQHQAN